MVRRQRQRVPGRENWHSRPGRWEAFAKWFVQRPKVVRRNEMLLYQSRQPQTAKVRKLDVTKCHYTGKSSRHQLIRVAEQSITGIPGIRLLSRSLSCE